MAKEVNIKYENSYGDTKEVTVMMVENSKEGRRIRAKRLLPPNCELKEVSFSSDTYKFS